MSQHFWMCQDKEWSKKNIDKKPVVNDAPWQLELKQYLHVGEIHTFESLVANPFPTEPIRSQVQVFQL